MSMKGWIYQDSTSVALFQELTFDKTNSNPRNYSYRKGEV